MAKSEHGVQKDVLYNIKNYPPLKRLVNEETHRHITAVKVGMATLLARRRNDIS